MIRPQKWQEYFIPFAELCKKNQIPVKIQLIWVNWTSYDESYKEYYIELKRQIEERSLTDYFIFYNVMTHDKLNEIMEKSHFSIITSKYETFWKSALESIATWLPTIVFSDIKAFNEFLEHRLNWIIVKRDIYSINMFKAFNELLCDKKLYEKISLKWIEMGYNYNRSWLFKKMEKSINSKLKQIWQ